MTEKRRCPDCGAPLPLDGMCTQCLIRLGLESGETREPEARETEEASEPGTIGNYRVVRKLGAGGMGVVYLAEQAEPIRRSVAIKIIKLGMNTREVVARFEAERQTLAEMDHPGIARVFEAGSTEDGRPYFVMEHVDGAPVTEYCDRNRLNTLQRVQLFASVCDAVHHAHLRGVIHRDLKPSNVLVTEVDGQSQPKVIDFGVAKATARSLVERSVFTELGQIVGTLEYMSPEQAELTGLDIDLRSDVYSLGVLFFELLVGSPPFEAKKLRSAGLEAMLRAIREDDSPRPSTRISTLGGEATDAAHKRRTDPPSLARHLRGDLDWIVMRALEKERHRRYDSAAELAAEARRYIDHEPVVAGPPGSVYRARKFVRRHRVGVTATTAVLLVLVSLVTFYTVRVRAQRERAEREAAKAERVVEFLKTLFEGADPRATGGVEVKVGELLSRGAERVDTELADQPGVYAEITGLMGSIYTALGDHGPARKFLEQTVEQRVELFGETHLDVATALADLAKLDYKEGRHEEAEASLRRALTIREASPDADPEQTALLHKDLGPVLRARGDLPGAIAEGERALEIMESLSREPDEAMIQVISVLGYTYLTQGDLEHAQPLLERGLSLARGVLGPRHPGLGYHLDYNAMLRRSLGDIEGYEQAVREALEIRRAALGENHPQTAESMHNVGVMLSVLGKKKEAEPWFRRALEVRKKIFGPRHRQVALTLYSLASILESEGQPEQARALFEDVVDIQRESDGPRHFATGRTLGRIGALSVKHGDPEYAEGVLREAVEILSEALPPGHQERSRPLLWLGWALIDTGRSAEAEGPLREALEIRRNTLPAGSPFISEPEVALAACLVRLGKTNEARELFERGAPPILKAMSPESWLARQVEATRELIAE